MHLKEHFTLLFCKSDGFVDEMTSPLCPYFWSNFNTLHTYCLMLQTTFLSLLRMIFQTKSFIQLQIDQSFCWKCQHNLHNLEDYHITFFSLMGAFVGLLKKTAEKMKLAHHTKADYRPDFLTFPNPFIVGVFSSSSNLLQTTYWQHPYHFSGQESCSRLVPPFQTDWRQPWLRTFWIFCTCMVLRRID